MSDTPNSKDLRGLLSLANWKEAEEESRPGLAGAFAARHSAGEAPGKPRMSPLLAGLAQRPEAKPHRSASAGPSVADLLRRRGEGLAREPQIPGAATPAAPEIPPRRSSSPKPGREGSRGREISEAQAGEDMRSILRRAGRSSDEARDERTRMPASRMDKAQPKQGRGIMGKIAGLVRREPKADAAAVSDTPPFRRPGLSRENPQAGELPRMSDLIARKTPRESRLPPPPEFAGARSPADTRPSATPVPRSGVAQPPSPQLQSSLQPAVAPSQPSASLHGQQQPLPPAPMPVYPAMAMAASSPVMPFAAPSAFYPAMPAPMQHPASAHFYWPQQLMPQPMFYAPPQAAWPMPMPAAAPQMAEPALPPRPAAVAEPPVRPSAANDMLPQPVQVPVPPPDPLTAEIDDVREQLRAFGDTLRALHRTRASRQIG
jgi:hypothetical protein